VESLEDGDEHHATFRDCVKHPARRYLFIVVC
jgi:hypothetical protein